MGGAFAPHVASFRAGYFFILRTLSRYAATPHKMFRPENPTITRLEHALYLDTGGQGKLKKGVVGQFRKYGLRQTTTLKGRSIIINSMMGTVLFGSYDALRDRNERRINSRDAMAALLAGGLHGTVCAPLEVICKRMTKQASNGPGKGIRAALFDGPPGQLRASITAFFPLCAARDSLGITAFFLTFEGLRVELQGCVPVEMQQHGAVSLFNTSATLAAGGSAGVAYRLVSSPFDVLLQRRIDAHEANNSAVPFIPEARRLLQERGLRGLLPAPRTLVSVFPSSALGLLVYEWLR